MKIPLSLAEIEQAGGYRIIYADPCWPYKQRGRGAAESHYRTMSVKDLAALPVPRIAARNAVLFLWGTWPNIFDCKPVIDGWGFKYKTLGFGWVKHYGKSGKVFWGGGHWSRANSEFCLLATRGDIRRVSASVHQIVETWDEQDDLILRAPVREHSAKPPEVRDRIVQLMGDLPRVELFARNRVGGWDAWGNEVPGGSDIDLAIERAA